MLRSLILAVLAVFLSTGAASSAIVADGGFEAGPFGGVWTETSTNFGTPLCSFALCGNGTGTGANSGIFWAWFGGISAFEDGSVSQSVVIPTGTATLKFFLEIPVIDTAADFLEILVDGIQVYLVTANAAFVGYTQQAVDISAFADGAAHSLAFHSTIFSSGGGPSNFFVDDVSITVLATVSEPATSVLFLVALAGLGFMTRRQVV